MKFSVKTSIIISTISAIVWVGLFALFYFCENDDGNYSKMNFSQVRGASAQRFVLSSDEILVSSKSANGNYAEDRILLSKLPASEDNILRIIRDKVVIFDQKVSSKYTKVIWDDAGEFFEVLDPDSRDNFLLKASRDEYLLIPSN